MIGSFGGEGGDEVLLVVVVEEYHLYMRMMKMARSVKAKGCKKKVVSFTSIIVLPGKRKFVFVYVLSALVCLYNPT